MKGQGDDVGEHEHDGSPGYAQNFDGHLPLHWLQPAEATSTESVLPSFCDLQLKTHRTLYGTTSTKLANGRFLPPSRDKSPKGSVDAPIQHLVDLINSHSRFCTLSSCSGRLSLFDPNGNGENGEMDNTAATHFTEASGKGRGRWVLVSHEPVDPEELVEAMKETTSTTTSETTTVFGNDSGDDNGDDSDEENDDSSSLQQPWTFRFEPLLLHVAAASLVDGRKLLTVALNMGFRESGLIVTDKRVTVAIRSNSLTTVTPLVPWTTNLPTSSSYDDSSLSVPDAFLRALVHDANQRLRANWKHLDRLYRSIESDLFAVRSDPPPIVIRSSSPTQDIPSLNLWNASAIATKTPNAQQIWVIGGYGCGPTSSAGAAAKRSSKVYQLERDGCGGTWRREKGGWRECDPRTSILQNTNDSITDQFLEIDTSSTNDKKEKKTLLKVDWCQTVPDLQGMTSCQLKPSNLTVAWGGRKSPARPSPSDNLYIFDSSQTRFGTACDVHGDLPKPRWGHQLLPLGENRAVLVGGCNHEDGALDDIFVLHFVSEDGKGHFYWEKQCTRLPTPRFHFGAAVLKNDTLLLVGGLESTKHLLQPFEDDDCENESPSNHVSSVMCAYRFGRSKSKKSTGNAKIRKTKMSCMIISTSRNSRGSGSSNEGWSGSTFFGSACCTLLSGNLLFVTGGITTIDELARSSAIQAFWVSSSTNNGFSEDKLLLQKIELGFDYQSNNNGANFDFGSLVHHCCVSVGDNEILLLGGGVPSFAFGESYARSQHLLIDADNGSAGVQNDKVLVNKSGIVNSASNLRENTSITIDSSSLKKSPDNKSKNSASKGSSFATEPKQRTNVVYVAPKDARKAKISLQQNGWLDKRFRMVKVDLGLRTGTSVHDDNLNQNKQAIALPISVPFVQVLPVFEEWILHHGEEELPFSTSQYASKTNPKS